MAESQKGNRLMGNGEAAIAIRSEASGMAARCQWGDVWGLRAKRRIEENREAEPGSRSSALTVLPDLWTLRRRLGSIRMRFHVIIKKLNETLD